MTIIKMPNMNHTNPEEININKIQIGYKGLIRYSHPQYGKSHFLVLRLPVCQLDKYPIEYCQAFRTMDKKIPVNLKIPMGQDFIETPFYVFLQNLLEKYGDKDKVKYPVFDSKKTSNYLKIKDMDSYEYSVTIIDNSNFKIKTTNRKLSSLSELYTVFSSDTQVIPYVMLYYNKMPHGDFITLRPVKFYIGNNINMEQIDYITKKQRHMIVPKFDFYDFNQIGKQVSLSDFTKYLENTDTKSTDTVILI
jgi:hypothetical protein